MWFIDWNLPLYSTEICAEHKDPPHPHLPAPAEKRTKGQVQLPCLIHCCLKLTLCVSATNAQAPIAGKPASVLSISAVRLRFDFYFLVFFIFFFFCQISWDMHAVDNFSRAALNCFGDVTTLRSSLLTSQPSQVKIYCNEMEGRKVCLRASFCTACISVYHYDFCLCWLFAYLHIYTCRTVSKNSWKIPLN